SVAFSQHGTRALSLTNAPSARSSDNKFALWNAENGILLVTGPRAWWSTGIALSHDGTRIVAGGWDHSLHLWDTGTGRFLGTVSEQSDKGKRESEWTSSTAFSPDGKHIVSGSHLGKLHLWDAATGALLRTFGHTDTIEWLGFSPDSARFAS